MITAIAASEIATKIGDTISTMQMEKIDTLIRGACQQGLFTCQVPFVLLPSTKTKLDELEYTSRTVSDIREGSYTIISWEKGGEE